ncbi:MAG TPA: sensory rhodopsin transducer [Mariniphaga sp.]|nr:sensory rhodopsin transducer [Mariniphaga sp.]
MRKIGYKKWVIPGGYIPFATNGREPELLSQDKISILNLNKEPTTIRMTVYYQEEEPVSGYPLEIKGMRVKKFRVNDLIDPFPVVLEKEYSLIIEADKPVVVQFLKMNTGHKNVAMLGTIAYGTDI